MICVINEAMSEDKAPMYAALEEQPTAANNVENGVSLPVTTTSDSGESGGDHVGTSDGGPEVIAQDHVGTENRGPRSSGSRVRDAPEIEEPRQTSGQSVKKPL